MNIFIKRPDSPRPPLPGSIPKSPSYARNYPSQQRDDIYLPKRHHPSLSAFPERPDIQHNQQHKTLIMPDLRDVERSHLIIENTSDLRNIEINGISPNDVQTTKILIASAIKSSESANLLEIMDRLHDIQSINCLSSETYENLKIRLYQKAYDVCIKLAEKASSTVDGGLVSLCLDKAEICANMSTSIVTLSKMDRLDIWMNSLILRRKGFILEALHHAYHGDVEESERSFKDALVIHKIIPNVPIDIKSIDPIYIEEFSQNVEILEILENPQRINESLSNFSHTVLKHAAIERMKHLSSGTVAYISPIRNSINILANITSQISSVYSVKSNLHSDTLQNIFDMILRTVHHQKKSPQAHRTHYNNSEHHRFKKFIHTHTYRSIFYDHHTAEKYVNYLLEKECSGQHCISEDSDDQRPERSETNNILSASNCLILKNVIRTLLNHGATSENTYDIVSTMLKIDLSSHEYNIRNIEHQDEQKSTLILNATRLPEILNDKHAHEYFSDLSKLLFLNPLEATKYKNKSSDVPALNLIGSIYDQIHNYQSRILKEYLLEIEKTPYSKYVKIDCQSTNYLHLVNIDILQYKVIHEFHKIKSLLDDTISDPVQNINTIGALIDFKNSYNNLKKAAERAGLNFPFEHLMYINIDKINIQIETLDLERIAQRKKLTSSTSSRKVQFGHKEIYIFEKNTNEDDCVIGRSEIEEYGFLYNQSIDNIQYYASEASIRKLLIEVSELKKHATRLNREYPHKEIHSAMKKCYNISLSKRITKSVEYARIGNVDQMSFQLRPISLYAKLANRPEPKIFPIIKMGYANSIQNYLNLFDQKNMHTTYNETENRRTMAILQQAKSHAEKFAFRYISKKNAFHMD